MIPYSKQTISSQDIKQVVKVLKSDFLTQGPQVLKFEKKINKYVKSKFTVAVNSATSALHLSCLALGLKKGDWLWTSSNSFVSSANCGLFCGAKIDLLDIELEDYNISIPLLKIKLEKAKVSNRLPKILVPVHFSGKPCDMKAIYKLSKKYKFKIVEDASHALGSKIYGKRIGNCKYSDLCVFSFHPVKNITTGEGGAITTNNYTLFKKLEILRSHGINKEKKYFELKNAPPWFFEQIALGYNYRMNDIEASLGISQLKQLNLFLKKRNELAKIYDQNLKNLPLILPRTDKIFFNAYHLYPIRLKSSDKKNRLKLFNFLKKKDIRVNIHYIPIYIHPYYKKLGFNKKNYPNNNIYYDSAMSIPLFPNLKKKEVFKVINNIKIFFNEK